MKISRVLHAGYIFEDGKEKEPECLLFDPIFENPFSVNAFAFPPVRFDIEKIKQQMFSAVFISHFHDDHCSMESLNLLNRSIPIYIYCLHQSIFDMLKELGFETVIPLNLNETIFIGNFKITVWPALDRDLDSIFQIQFGDLSVLNVVDSWIDSATLGRLAEKTKWDLVLWPFQTMREIEVLSPNRFPAASTEIPVEWVEPLQKLNPRFLVPSSCQFQMEDWSWYNQTFFPISYSGFQKQMGAIIPAASVVRMEPGESFTLSKNGFVKVGSLNWIEIMGEQKVDYSYLAGTLPPSMSELAKKLRRIDSLLEKSAFEFCQMGLLQIWNRLEIDEESYFQKPRIWLLSVYSQEGIETSFYYKIEGNKIAVLSGGNQKPSWHTEISASKIFSALNEGESLTSLYVRINSSYFDSATEAALLDVDLMEDPLLRCLYSGEVGSYQRAQLDLVLKASVAKVNSQKESGDPRP